jgi:hypothetical protein
MTLKVRILPFLTTFAQLSARLKNFLRGWLLVLGIKEGLVKCATVSVKSVVILEYNNIAVYVHVSLKILPKRRFDTKMFRICTVFLNTVLRESKYVEKLTKTIAFLRKNLNYSIFGISFLGSIKGEPLHICKYYAHIHLVDE